MSDDYTQFDMLRFGHVADRRPKPTPPPPKPELDQRRFDFIREYVIAARRGGRSADCGSPRNQSEIVDTANSLYELIVSKSMRVMEQNGIEEENASR